MALDLNKMQDRVDKELEGFLYSVYPKGEERWIKVKYVDPDKAMKTIRLNSPHFNNKDSGFEITSIGIREEHLPQVEALLELKVELSRDMTFYQFPAALDSANAHIDRKIEELLDKVLISKT